jgi:hypothetical protein
MDKNSRVVADWMVCRKPPPSMATFLIARALRRGSRLASRLPAATPAMYLVQLNVVQGRCGKAFPLHARRILKSTKILHLKWTSVPLCSQCMQFRRESLPLVVGRLLW